MISKIDHIGVAVKSIQEVINVYRDGLGLSIEGIEEVEEQKVRAAVFSIGENRIELLESTDPEGPIAKHIMKRGEGIHHIALRVENIEETMAMLMEKGVSLIDNQPRMGVGGSKIAFVHPKLTKILLELVEH